eukprot:CAMPEP_0182423610 /NCGR_PEP_ID=MMETSP1167-20130531/9661_1 /TAXON_ID=2988 /ORGANISM="Mallomonas Sp, Strain CCMP3275" /LENGTH=516 /DNA_ID=CAMNT_0024602745 /DNA_START=377 /DNA_END=1927 /DNA_ORIENTATION=+
MSQKSHTVLRNFPVLGNVRYVLENLRPEIRQYFLEKDEDGKPFDRLHRSVVYQRAKDVRDTIPLGTRLDVYANGYTWANHSMFPVHIDYSSGGRVLIGGKDCSQKYSASILNVSAMSFGALSHAAITCLNTAAKMGNFYHNTGEGGVSRFHLAGGGDIVWNIGTGYFGCRNPDGSFSRENFTQMAVNPVIKMIEIKLSQGAKPGHGGLLPGAKVTKFIAEARGVSVGVDCVSPPSHSAFNTPIELLYFVKELRQLSGGKPVGFKLCVGRHEEFAAIVAAMLQTDICPDFITIDGGEGGTGAAPPEFSNSIGMPLTDGLTFAHAMLVGAGVRDEIKLICSGKVSSGFSIVKSMGMGADLCNSARAMMFALGCIQALKCDTNKCPTGIATQNEELISGLDPELKTVRVFNYHKHTVKYALDIVGAMGHHHTKDVSPRDIMKRVSMDKASSFADLYLQLAPNSLLDRTAPSEILAHWDAGVALNHRTSNVYFKKSLPLNNTSNMEKNNYEAPIMAKESM